MRWRLIVAVLVFLFLLEGSVLPIFIPTSWSSPRLVLVLLILLALHTREKRLFLLALIFGLLSDLIYSDLIGVYTLSFTLIPYLCSLINQYFQLNILLVTLSMLTAIFIHENFVYLCFSLFDLSGEAYTVYPHIQTALINTAFSVVIYRLLETRFEKMADYRPEDEGNL
jgi:rod shape-determining protein MreD